MNELVVTLVGPVSTTDVGEKLIKLADINLADHQADCVVPCLVVQPALDAQQTSWMAFVVRAKAYELLKYCQDGLASFMTSQFLTPITYELTGEYNCAVATDMVAVAQYLGEASADTAKAWPLNQREFVLLMISSRAFQSDCAQAIRLIAPDAVVQGISVAMMPSDSNVGTFVAAPVPSSCLEQHEDYDDFPLAPPTTLVPVAYEDGSGGQTDPASRRPTSAWVAWTLGGLALFAAAVVVYDQVNLRKGQ